MDKLLHSFVFSSWDNVVGPKVVKIWPASVFSKCEKFTQDSIVDEIGEEINETDAVVDNPKSSSLCELQRKPEEDEIAKYISIHTLTGHLVKPKHSDYESINQIFLDVPTLGFVSQTATFYCLCLHSNSDKGNGTNNFEEPYLVSLSVVFYHKNFSRFLKKFQPLTIHLLEKVVECLKVGLSQDLSYFEESELRNSLGTIYQTLLDTSQSTIKNQPSPLAYKHILKKSHIQWDVLITAVLTTMGCCCIVGKNVDHINHLIDFLTFFLPDQHKIACSRYACDRFTGGLFVQGVIENSMGSRAIQPADILLNDYPLTLLDLSNQGRIRFTGLMHEHFRIKQRYLREQELNIIQKKISDVPFSTGSIFRSFRESSRYVRWCLEQLATHNSEHWSRIISAFHQALALQAHDVIKAFSPKDFQSSERLRSRRMHLKKSMKLADVDFWLLIATGERLRPGFARLFSNFRI